MHKDHLGSIDLVTDEAGLAAEARSFDAWGRPRNADWTPAANDPALTETPRGFTDHEHIQAVGLIHMNGRVQDPELGRFVSADPSDALNPGVGFNRYSYALNNPLSLVDPDGFDNHHPGVDDDEETGDDEEENDVPDDLRDYEKIIREELEGLQDIAGYEPRTPEELAIDELYRVRRIMKRLNLVGADQFFHCEAACRATKTGASPEFVRDAMKTKELFDYLGGRAGIYPELGKPKSHEEMTADVNEDLRVNEIGISTPENVDCNTQCGPIIDDIEMNNKKVTASVLRELFPPGGK